LKIKGSRALGFTLKIAPIGAAIHDVAGQKATAQALAP
jgi:hypothetical protein